MDKRVLITGGTRGIGRAIAKKFFESGNHHVTITTRNSRKIDINEHYAHEVMEVDFTFVNHVGLKNQLECDYDILINNAGINKVSNFEDFDEEDFDEILEVNLYAPFVMSKLLIPYMKKQRWGRIINIGSIQSEVALSGRAAYTSSKFGLLGLTKVMSAELAQFGVLVNMVSPGFTETELTREILGEEKMKLLENDIPIGRLAKPHEIAEVVFFLSGDVNSYISGQNIIVDGGFVGV